MKNYKLTPEAETNILDIIDFIAKDSPEAAARVLIDIEQAFEKLGETPGLGHYREDLLSQDHRFFGVYSYLIVYRWQSAPVEVIAVVHGARNLGPVFQRQGFR